MQQSNLHVFLNDSLPATGAKNGRVPTQNAVKCSNHIPPSHPLKTLRKVKTYNPLSVATHRCHNKAKTQAYKVKYLLTGKTFVLCRSFKDLSFRTLKSYLWFTTHVKTRQKHNCSE